MKKEPSNLLPTAISKSAQPVILVTPSQPHLAGSICAAPACNTPNQFTQQHQVLLTCATFVSLWCRSHVSRIILCCSFYPLTHSVLRWYRQDVYTGRRSQGCMYWFGCLHDFTGLELFDIPNQRNSWSISRQIHEFMASCRYLQRTFRTHAPVASQTIWACCQNWPKSC
jgi:hypothetical protein